MKLENFDIDIFVGHLNELETHLKESIEEDPDYSGEADELMESIHLLQKEFGEKGRKKLTQKKFDELIPHIYLISQTLKELYRVFNEEDGEESEDDDDQLEFEDFEDDEYDEDDEEYDDDDDNEEYEDDEYDHELCEEEFEEFRELHRKMIDCFLESDQIKALSEKEQDSSEFVLDAFLEYISLVGSPDVLEWSRQMVREVCLERFPEKVIAEPELFELVAPVLHAFFRFLYEEEEVLLAPELGKYLETIQDEIPIAAANKDLWGREKRFAIEAMEAEVDLEDPEQLQDFIQRFNANLLEKAAKD